MILILNRNRFLLGIGVGAEYPCGSVAASEQSEEEGIAKNAQNRWFALATSMFPRYIASEEHHFQCQLHCVFRLND